MDFSIFCIHIPKKNGKNKISRGFLGLLKKKKKNRDFPFRKGPK